MRSPHALDAFVIDGIRHNMPFLSALMQHPRWRSGRLSTGFIAEEFPKGFPRVPTKARWPDDSPRSSPLIDHIYGERKRQISGPVERPSGDARAPPRGLARSRRRSARDRAQGEAIVVRFSRPTARLGRTSGDVALEAGRADLAGHDRQASIAVQVRAIPNGLRLAHQGVRFRPTSTPKRGRIGAANAGEVDADTGKKLLCPMPGLVIRWT